jgi:hypothetical protein
MLDHFHTLRVIRNAAGIHTCLECLHRVVTSDPNFVGCKLAEGVTPPIEIIVYGCNKWEMDIPF